MTTETIVARELYKSYGAIRAVERVSLSVGQGRSLSILGRSGCGKTTLLKMLALISKPEKGTLLINGESPSEISERQVIKLRQRIGFSFQEPLLLPYLTALQNLSLVVPVLDSTRSKLEQEGVELLSRLGLRERLGHMPSKLSVGEKKRVDLARAIVKHPTVIVADEPYANLDPETSSLVSGVFREYLKEGVAIVYSCTEPSYAKLADECLKL